MSDAGLRCPICGSWYWGSLTDLTNPDFGDDCRNRTGSGPNPPEEDDAPCPGKLVVDTPELAAKFRKPKGY